MVKSTKKAFTLVELIVVITILAILGTIAFISLSGYSAEARDSRRVTNISNLTDKINIELVKGKTVPSALVDTTATSVNTSTTWLTGSWISTGLRGAANFATIKENGANFKDPKATAASQDYPLAIAIGGTWSGAYQFLQMAASLEADNMARVRGNYFKYNGLTNDSLILSTSGSVVTDGGATLPYAIN